MLHAPYPCICDLGLGAGCPPGPKRLTKVPLRNSVVPIGGCGCTEHPDLLGLDGELLHRAALGRRRRLAP